MATRTFLKASFAIPATDRYAEALHYGLMRHLEPRLVQIPFDKPFGWPRHPLLHVASRYLINWQREVRKKWGVLPGPIRSDPRLITPIWDHSSALEIHLPWLRQLCLDQSSSCLWDLVDKPVFEQLTSETTPMAIRQQEQRKLYGIASLFLYEQLRKGNRLLRNPER